MLILERKQLRADNVGGDHRRLILRREGARLVEFRLT